MKHLKHLYLRIGEESDGQAFQPALQLPMLGTLCFDQPDAGMDGFVTLPVLDVLGCQHLTNLSLKGVWVDELSMSPACSLDIDLHEDRLDSRSVWRGPMWQHLESAGNIGFSNWDNSFSGCISDAERGLFGRLQKLKALSLRWPRAIERAAFDSGQKEEFRWGAESLLTELMPTNGQALLNLRSIVISAQQMKGTIPVGVPNLAELVIMSEGCLGLSFEDPSELSATLKTFYAFGKPLNGNAPDMVRLVTSGNVFARGLTFGAVSARMERVGSDSHHYCARHSPGSGLRDASCVYRRPATTPDMSIEQLHSVVQQLVKQCRCGACLECLNLAGCVDV